MTRTTKGEWKWWGLWGADGRKKGLTYSLGNSPMANTHSRLVWEWGAGRQRGAESEGKESGGKVD